MTGDEGTGGEASPQVVPEGGDAACWANLVCDECGAVESDGHRAGCSRANA